MTASRQVWTARFQTPDRIQRGSTWTLECPVYFGADLDEPATGTCTVTNSNNVAVKTGPVVVVGEVAEFTLDPADTQDEQLGEGWRVEWALDLDGGAVSRTFRNTASLVLQGLYPVIADLDLFRRSSALDPANADRYITDALTYQPAREEAWVWLDAMLVRKGRRPQLIMSSTDLRETHINKTLELIYRDLSQRNLDAYLETANQYQALALSAFNSLAFIYDAAETGQPDGDKREPAVGSVWLNGRASGIARGSGSGWWGY